MARSRHSRSNNQVLRSTRTRQLLLAVAASAPLLTSSVYGASATWNVNGNANWNLNTNWLPNTTFPNGVDQVADISKLDTNGATRVITVNTGITIGTLLLGDANASQNYQIAPGTGSLTLDVISGNAAIINTAGGGRVNAAGGDFINSNILLADTVDITTLSGRQYAFILSGNITESAAGKGLNKYGFGTLQLSGTNSYTGATNVNAGVLALAGVGPISSSSAVTVGSTAMLTVAEATATARTTTVNSLTLNAGANLGFDWTASGTDVINSTNAASTSGIIGIALNGSTPNAGGNILTAASGLSGASYLLANNTNYTASIGVTDTAISVSGYTAQTALTTAYWYGGQVTGALNAMAFSNGTASNWSTDGGSLVGTGLVAGSTTNVIFSATGATQQSNVVLGANMTVNTVTFNDTTPVTIANDGHYLALYGQGTTSTDSALIVNENATINANLFLGGGTNTTTTNHYGYVAASKTLNFGGGLLSANNFYKTGTGTIIMSGVSQNTSQIRVREGDMNVTGTINGATSMIVADTAGINATLTIGATGNLTTQTGINYIGYRTGNGTVNLNGGTLNSNGEWRVGGSDTNNGAAENATGVLNMTAGVGSISALTIARGNNNVAIAAGTVNLSGGTLTSGGTVTVGFAGANNLGQLNITGGVLNVGTTSAVAMVIEQWDTTRGEVNISSGTLNLNSNSDIRFLNGNTSTLGSGTLNQNGGAINFYSDNGVTFSGVGGELNMAASGGATAFSAYNLNGGTLTVGQVVSSSIVPTRTFNFNGGVIRPTGNNTNWINIGTGTGSSTATANVLTGGARIDTRGFDVTVVSALLGSVGDGGLTKTGNGILTLSGASNTYFGQTIVNGGGLVLNGNLPNTAALSMASSTSLGIKGTRTVANNLTLNTNALSFEFSGGTLSSLAMGGSASVSGSNVINVTVASGVVTPGTYTLISATGGLGSGFTLGTVPAGFYNYSLASSTATQEILSIVGNPTPTGPTYWTGLGSAGSGDANRNWGAGSGIGTSNWSTTADGLTDPQQVPGAVSDVIFTATNAGGSPALSTKLDAAYSLASLKFDVPVSTGITSVGIDTNAQTLTIGASGLSVAATSNASGSITGTGQVKVNGAQTWANDSSTNALTVSAPVSSASGTPVLTIGGTGTGTVTLGGGISTLGLTINKDGITNLGGTSTLSGNLWVKKGTLEINNASLTTSTWNSIGQAGTDNGTLTVKGTSVLTINNDLNIGDIDQTQGTLNIQDTAALNFTTTGTFVVGSGNNAASTAAGIVNQSGGVVTIANTGNPSMVVGGRGTFTTVATASGTYNLSGGSLTNAGLTSVGHYGTGLVNQTGGTANYNNWLVLGRFSTGKGTYNLSGGTINNTGSVLLGQLGLATMTISGTGQLSTTAGVYLGYLGDAVTAGTLNLDGGTLTTPVVVKGAGFGTVFLNGGTLKASAATTSFMQGLTGAYVKAGGAKIDSQANAITIAQPLLHDASVGTDGGLTKSGTGILTLTGASTYNGPTVISGGAIAVSNAYTGFSAGGGAITVQDGAALNTTYSAAGTSLGASAMTVGSSTGGILNFSLNTGSNPTVPVINLAGNLGRIGTSTINVSGTGLTSGAITLLQHVGETGAGTFVLGTVPSRTSGTLDQTGNLVILNLTSDIPRWTGLGDGSWVAATQTPKNWKTLSTNVDTDFIDVTDGVIFDGTASNFTVNIPSQVSPAGVTVTGGTDYSFVGTGTIAGSGALAKTGANKLIIANDGTNTFTGAIQVNSGTLQIGAGTTSGSIGTGAITNNGVLSVNRSDAIELTNIVDGTGTIEVAAGGLRLSGANAAYAGTITVANAATLYPGTDAAFGTTAAATVLQSGAQLFVDSARTIAEPIEVNSAALHAGGSAASALTGTLTITGGATLNADGGATQTITGAINGAGTTLTKIGAGVSVLAGTSTNYGNTDIQAGTLSIGAGTTSGTLGSGDVTVTGVLRFNHSDDITVSNKLSGAGNIINIGSGTVNLTSTSTDANGTVTGGELATSGTLRGTTILSGSGNFGTLTVNNGSIRLTSTAPIASLIQVNIAANNDGQGQLQLTNNITDIMPDVTTTFAARNSATAAVRSMSGNNSMANYFQLATGGANYWVQVDAGSTLQIKGAPSYGNIAFSVPSVGTVGNRTITLTGAGAGTVSGSFQVVDAGVTTLSVAKSGSGTWTLSAANNYNGNTISNAGTLILKDGANDLVETGVNGGITNGGAIVLDYNDDGNTGSWGSQIITDLESNAATYFVAGRIRTTAPNDITKAIGWLDDTTAKTFTTRYTYKGDINLSGVVDSTDFAMLAAGYGKFEPTVASVIWKDGDVNYDGKVNTVDFNYLAGNFGLAAFGGAELGAELGATPGAALGAVVPEPATLGVLGMGLMGLLARRRR